MMTTNNLEFYVDLWNSFIEANFLRMSQLAMLIMFISDLTQSHSITYLEQLML